MIALAYREILNKKINNLFLLVILGLNAYFDKGTITTSFYFVIWAYSAIYTKEEEAYLRTMNYSKKDIFQYTLFMFVMTLLFYSLFVLIINLVFSHDIRNLLVNLHYVLVFSFAQTGYRVSINHQASNIKGKIIHDIILIVILIIIVVFYLMLFEQLDYPMEQFVYLSLYILIVNSLSIVYYYLSYGGVDYAKNK